MAVSSHIKELETKHSTIDDAIKTEMKNPAPDMIRLQNLKKKKLHLKEQISEFRER